VGNGRNGGDEVGHHEDGVDAAGADGGCDGGHHGAVAEVDVHVSGGREGEVVEEAHIGGWGEDFVGEREGEGLGVEL
jgi:hypothetical protein